ncbi:MAG: WD40/YVTN/BNR-like repeat-containing protein, partial [Noviherbaspirillum sp.]
VFIVGEQGLVQKLDREAQRFAGLALPYQGTLFGVTGTPGMTLVYGLRGNAYRSIDGGANWTKVDTGMNAGLASGVLRADGSVVLVSQAGQVLLSTDDGASFNRVKVATAAPAFAMADVGKGTIALAGVGGVRIEMLK